LLTEKEKLGGDFSLRSLRVRNHFSGLSCEGIYETMGGSAKRRTNVNKIIKYPKSMGKNYGLG
jgi:hypothetical protein